MIHDRIVIDRRICHGKPVIRGTRVPVTVVVGSLAAGMSFEDLEREYGVSAEDVRAALVFADAIVDADRVRVRPALE